MKRADPDVARDRTYHRLQTRLHLARRLVRKRNGKDALGRNFQFAEQIGNAMGQNAGFTASSARKNQYGTIALPNGG